MNDHFPKPQSCPECGAPPVNGLNCWGQLGAIIAWEWQDPELMAEHFLTVASYNLQHPAQFTEAALVGLRQQFLDHLDNNLPVAEIRRRVGRIAEGNVKVLVSTAERHPVPRHWPMTIAAVYLPEQPTGAAERVKTWAATIRKEL